MPDLLRWFVDVIEGMAVDFRAVLNFHSLR
jgi:hypothetical protein